MGRKEPSKETSKQRSRLQIKINYTDQGDAPPLQAYAFSSGGKFIAGAPVEKDAAVIDMPAEFNGRTMEIILGPRMEKDQSPPSAAALKRLGAYSKSTRFLIEQPLLEFAFPHIIFPPWCLCFVRGRLVRRFTLPDGITVDRPVCNARVHICEVDRIPLVIDILPAPNIFRLRDDLLDKLRVIPRPFPPGPWPGPEPTPGPFPGPGPNPGPMPGPFRRMSAPGAAGGADSDAQSVALNSADLVQQHGIALSALAGSNSVGQIRRLLSDLSQYIAIFLCDLYYIWSYFRTECLTTVEVDDDGRFDTFIVYDCRDAPDLYFWVEQFQEGAWTTVYRPSIGCGTYWNYTCGTEITLNLPSRAIACEDPAYDLPTGVTLFVLPYAIGSSPIWGKPPGSPPAPVNWVRTDGLINYTDAALGLVNDAPFGGTLNFIHDDSYFIPVLPAGIKYYRYSYRRANPGSPNTGADDASWTPILTPLSRGYRIEYSDRLPEYAAYPVGPEPPIGGHSGLFQFKPRNPPSPPGEPTVIAVEWVSGNLSEVAASWNTTGAAPAMSSDVSVDAAGDFEVKIEVFNAAGALVTPGPATFQFLALQASGMETRLAAGDEIAAGAYVLTVHIDNNLPVADLPQPSYRGVAASDDCGFLRYDPDSTDEVTVRFLADHPNDRAVFSFGIMRGSNGLGFASTPNYVEVAAASAPTGSATPYTKIGDYYQRLFTPDELVEDCGSAAFAANLGVYGKATNGVHRLGLNAPRQIAFALAEEEDE